MKEILFYKTINGKCPFLEWYNSLDKQMRKKIVQKANEYYQDYLERLTDNG